MSFQCSVLELLRHPEAHAHGRVPWALHAVALQGTPDGDAAVGELRRRSSRFAALLHRHGESPAGTMHALKAYAALQGGLPSSMRHLPGASVVHAAVMPPAPRPVPRLREVRIAGDGNCLFRAVAQGLAGGRLSPGEEARTARVLRGRAVRALCARNSALLPFVHDRKLHCVDMLRDGTYGDHPEVAALAEVTGARIEVWQPPGQLATAQEPSRRNARRGNVVVRLMHRNGNHYNLLLR